MDVTFPVLESLDEEKIRAVIESAQHAENLFRIDVFDLISSTNTYLLECAKKKNVSGWFCFAEQQSRGRGRLGRTWYSPRGANIYCSVLWCFDASGADLSALSLAVAVMVAETLSAYGVAVEVGLKWPNDILVEGRKLGGILLERLPECDGVIPVVIGIGINLQLPEGSDTGWVDVAEMVKEPIARNRMAGLLVNELLRGLPVYQRRGLVPFIERWRGRDVLFGKQVTIQVSSDFSVVGVMTGINESGELLLKMESGEVKHFRCGDVSVKM